MPKGVYKNPKAALAKRKATLAAKRAAANPQQEIPLDAIPERRPVVAHRRKSGIERSVYCEYDIGRNQMMLVMGKLALPLKVKA